jgi:hypothetical protein
MKRLLFIALVVLLASCQPAFINGKPDEYSPYFNVPVDSKIILRKAVTVPARDDSVYFQRGRVLRWQDVNVYGAYCSLKLADKRDASQTVNPDEFPVRRITQERRFRLGSSVSSGIQVASADMLRLAAIDNEDSGFTYEVLATVMFLRSERQSNVSEVACADWSTPQGITPISVNKIRQVLGDWFELQLAPTAP